MMRTSRNVQSREWASRLDSCSSLVTTTMITLKAMRIATISDTTTTPECSGGCSLLAVVQSRS